MTCEGFVRAHADRFYGRTRAATAAYRALFHGDSAQDQLEAQTLAVTSVQREQSDEGEVAKFVLRVAGAGRAPDERSTRRNTNGSADDPQSEDRAGHARSLEWLETESVLIPMLGRSRVGTHTLCVSSQIGCAMGCTFCETAQMGLVRNLTAAEIVAQWWAAAHVVGVRPSNIVFMGMGEPMDNLDAVLDAIAVLTDHRGPCIPMSRVAISTVGRVDGIERLGERVRAHGWHKLGLAVSLNASNDEVRSQIMPLNRAVPMGRLREALLAYPLGRNKLCIEYVLIPGVNDADEHARELAEYLKPWLGRVPRVMVNVIPYNPRRNSPWPAPTEGSVDRFVRVLADRGIYVKRRRTKGTTMMGACGQLGNEHIRHRRAIGDVPISISAGRE
jgi:23S rRNA (adenine2503-C2)-methyltransferase